MTEKRFIGSSGGVYDQYKSDRFAWYEWEEILQIMNNLNEKARERSKALSKLQKENEQLKAQLYCDDEEGVCIICKHHYLKKGNIFYISKCEKGHEECSTDALKHCKDFEIKELQE